MTADSSPLLSLCSVAVASVAAAQVPSITAAAGVGFGEGENPAPLLVWYLLGGLAFVAMLAKNLIEISTAWGARRGSKQRAKEQAEAGEGCDTEGHSGHVSYVSHNKDIGDAYSRIERLRTEQGEQIRRLTSTIGTCCTDIAATKAEVKTNNLMTREMLKLLREGRNE